MRHDPEDTVVEATVVATTVLLWGPLLDDVVTLAVVDVMKVVAVTITELGVVESTVEDELDKVGEDDNVEAELVLLLTLDDELVPGTDTVSKIEVDDTTVDEADAADDTMLEPAAIEGMVVEAAELMVGALLVPVTNDETELDEDVRLLKDGGGPLTGIEELGRALLEEIALDVELLLATAGELGTTLAMVVVTTGKLLDDGSDGKLEVPTVKKTLGSVMT